MVGQTGSMGVTHNCCSFVDGCSDMAYSMEEKRHNSYYWVEIDGEWCEELGHVEGECGVGQEYEC